MSTPGERGTYPVAMLILPTSTITKLRAWVGVTVAFRDPFGVRFVGVFWAVAAKPRRGEPGYYDAEFVLNAVSVADGQ
jgi:hypothetical protein